MKEDAEEEKSRCTSLVRKRAPLLTLSLEPSTPIPRQDSRRARPTARTRARTLPYSPEASYHVAKEHTNEYRGTSLTRKRPPPQDPPRTLGRGLRWGPREGGGSYELGTSAEAYTGAVPEQAVPTGVPRSSEHAHPPMTPPGTLGIGLRQVPRGGVGVV